MIKTVLLDPPWMERGAGKCKRGADKHYPLVPTPEMPKVVRKCPFWASIAEDAHLYMWVTNNFLEDGLWLMKTLGFRYITNLVWVKDKFGIGRYFRGQHELCLFGTKGRGWGVRTELNDISTVIHSNRGKHSKKPESFYDLIESRSEGNYLEVFARQNREGWCSWGNEIEDAEGINLEENQIGLWQGIRRTKRSEI